MRVLILSATPTSPNFGVRALAEGLSLIARQSWGEGVEIDFASFEPYGEMVSFGPRAVIRDVLKFRGEISATLLTYDVIIESGGGDSFTDIYGIKRLLFSSYAQKRSRALGIPVVFGPQTIGPFKTVIGRAIGKSCLLGARTVLSRDSQSSAYSAELGRSVDATATDVVFALPQPIKALDSDIQFNVSGLLWAKNSHVNFEKYRIAVRETISALIEAGRSVSLLPHVLGVAGEHDSDLEATERLQTEFGKSVSTIEASSLWEVRSAIAGAKVVIASRMHASLNALSLGVPTIPWAYSRKFIPLMSDLGWRFGLDLREVESACQETMLQLNEIEHFLPVDLLVHLKRESDNKMQLVISSLR